MFKGNPNEPLEYIGTPQQPKTGQSCCQSILEYFHLLARNPSYRLYLLSHICQHVGDWYIRIASLLTLDRLSPESATSISILVLVRTLPFICFSQIGGALADSLDRRYLMMTLDILGAFATLGFLIALRQESLVIFYAFSAIRATLHALYEPATRALVPMLVSDEYDLKRAVTWNQMAWAGMLAIGGVIAGTSVSYFGLQVCFIWDSVTYGLSAAILYCIPGTSYKVENPGPTLSRLYSSTGETQQQQQQHHTIGAHCMRCFHPLCKLMSMLASVFHYLWICGFGLCVLLKSSGSVLWGAADILNIEYAHVEDDEAATSQRLGWLFTSIGIGGVVGPLMGNLLTNAHYPYTIQRICILGIALEGFGYLGWSLAQEDFVAVCLSSGLRATGSSIIFMNSTLLLQELSVTEMLGRVLGTEFALFMLMDAVTAWVTGRVLDAGVSKSVVSIGVAVLAAVLFTFWTIYHCCGLGAARAKFNSSPQDQGGGGANIEFA